MLNVRSAMLIFVVFAGAFYGVRWIRDGMPIPGVHVVPLTADSRIPNFAESSRKHIAAAREQEWLESQTAQSDGDPERDRLRTAVIEAATAFTLSPCNDEFKDQYLQAAAAYARSFETLAGCPKYPTFSGDRDALMERADKIFKSPADGPVKGAIQAVHDMGISTKDYPGGIGPAVAALSGSGNWPFGEFSCTRAKASVARRDHPDPAPTPHRFNDVRPR
jgi:hypothetical protein